MNWKFWFWFCFFLGLICEDVASSSESDDDSSTSSGDDSSMSNDHTEWTGTDEIDWKHSKSLLKSIQHKNIHEYISYVFFQQNLCLFCCRLIQTSINILYKHCVWVSDIFTFYVLRKDKRKDWKREPISKSPNHSDCSPFWFVYFLVFLRIWKPYHSFIDTKHDQHYCRFWYFHNR